MERLFGRAVAAGICPEELVACGAAVQAGILSGETRDIVLVDVTPLGLGVETADKKMTTLVRRNSILPASAKAVFTTVTDYQQSACIKVLQGERSHGEDNVLLGSFCLDNLQRGKRGEPDIEVCFNIDTEGILHVYARDLKTGSRRSVRLEAAAGVGEQEVREMVIEARAAELEDLYAAG